MDWSEKFIDSGQFIKQIATDNGFVFNMMNGEGKERHKEVISIVLGAHIAKKYEQT